MPKICTLMDSVASAKGCLSPALMFEESKMIEKIDQPSNQYK